LLDKYDQNKDGQIQWVEFVDMMVTLRGSGVKFAEETNSTKHSVSDEEVVAFSNTLNQIMKDNEYWKVGNEHGNGQIDSTSKESMFF
jgi:hypothetical protein